MKAHASQARVSTRKVRLVADSIRNMSAADALLALQMAKKHGSYPLMKTLKSAIANAVNNNKMTADNLVIARLEVNEGPFLKRFHASTRGRIHGYKKRSSHITIVLKEKDLPAGRQGQKAMKAVTKTEEKVAVETKATKKTTKKEETK